MNHERWEHKVVSLSFSWRPFGDKWIVDANEAMNREGAQGWQLVSTQMMGARVTLFFKRPR